jgi:hypothetical protein
VGKAKMTTIRGGNLYSPTISPSPLIEVHENAEDTSIRDISFSSNGGHTEILDLGARTRLSKSKSIYPITWRTDRGTPNIGNGVLIGDYTREGTLCVANATWIAGTSTTYQDGFWEFSLPFKIGASNRSIGQAMITRSNDSKKWMCLAWADAGTNFLKLAVINDGQLVDSNHPVQFSPGDRIDISISYPFSSSR